MKTIQISDELYERLLEISKELNSQNHLGTAMPYLFQVKDIRRMPTFEWVDVKWYEFVNTDRQSSFDAPETKEKLLKMVKEEYENSDEETPLDLEDYNEDELESVLYEKFWYEKLPYTEIEVLTNWFFTRKAVENHIERNSYHYSKPESYLTHSFRNPDMETVMEFLCQISWGELHK